MGFLEHAGTGLAWNMIYYRETLRRESRYTLPRQSIKVPLYLPNIEHCLEDNRYPYKLPTMDIELVLDHLVCPGQASCESRAEREGAGREICRYRSQDLVLSLISTSARIPQSASPLKHVNHNC